MLDEINYEAEKLILKACGKKAKKSDVESTLETARKEFGDISSRIAFVLAPKEKKNPAEIAKELVKKIDVSKSRFFSKAEAVGPYINFYLNDAAHLFILEKILKDAEKYGSGKKKKGKVMVEYPAVNPNKPWHIGHLRNAILGESVSRILEFSGRKVERADLINDLGLQVSQSLWGYIKKGKKIEGKADRWLGEEYVDVAKKFEKDESVQKEVREIMKKLEEGGNKTSETGRMLTEECVKAQYETGFSYDIFHDVLIFESDIIPSLFEEGIELLKKNKAVVHETSGKNAGCWVVKLSGKFIKEFGELKEPDKILIRSDGTATYTGKDVMFHIWKFGKFRKSMLKYEPFVKQANGKIAYKSSPKGRPMEFGSADAIINVIGVEQRYPQRVVVEILERLGYKKEASNYIHLAYEHVGLPEEKFSGRKGTWIGYTADELLEESKKRVRERIKGEMSELLRKEIEAAVGEGAIKFAFLKTGADKRMTFKWEEALSLEGDSGPYMQYAYVRTKGILEKAKIKPSPTEKYPFNDDEKELLKKLSEFPYVAEKAAKELSPQIIAKYLLELSSDFNKFYTKCPVLNAEKEEQKKTRLSLVLSTSIVVSSGLNLLGIRCPERM